MSLGKLISLACVLLFLPGLFSAVAQVTVHEAVARSVKADKAD